MIRVLHNPFDEASRTFVEEVAEGLDVLSYPDCVTVYPCISAFPTLVTDTDGWTEPERMILDLVLPARSYKPGIEMLRAPESVDEIMTWIDEIQSRDPYDRFLDPDESALALVPALRPHWSFMASAIVGCLCTTTMLHASPTTPISIGSSLELLPS